MEGARRIEELAQETGVSVDTIRFYQKRRLLPPPRREGRIAWYTPEHIERLARIRELQGRGFSLAVIRRLLDGELDAADEPLAAAVAQAGETSGELLTLAELARRARVPEAILDAASDVEVVVAGLALLDVGLPLPGLLELARHHHDVTRAIAEESVRMFDEHVRRPLREAPISESERANHLVDAFRTLLPAVTTLVAQHFRAVLLEVAQEHLESVGEPVELEAASAEVGWRRAVLG